jgi:RimJ/RimL family protein N-acetyltransferase
MVVPVDEVIRTARLDLRPVTPAMIEALLRGEAALLERLAGAGFPRPLEAPPLFAQHAPVFRHQMRVVSGRGVGWRFWFLVEREAARVVGVAGLPGAVIGGAARIGYSIYPDAQEHGFATEAVRDLVDWLLVQPGVTQVQATIAPENAASLEVARKAGMREVGTSWDEDGELLVLARDRA